MTQKRTQGVQVPTEEELDALCDMPRDEFDALVAVTFSEDGRIPLPRDLSPEDWATEDEIGDRLVDEAIEADRRAAECRS